MAWAHLEWEGKNWGNGHSQKEKEKMGNKIWKGGGVTR
jgi:hypothetical protein